MCGMLPMLEVNSLFPFNPSLNDEIQRLFDVTLNMRPLPTVDEVMEDFRHNGRDFEYCPDVDTDVSKQSASRRKKNKKPLPTECVFCRNNGEEETYYRQHLLKDVDGRVECPVLRAYTCPICGATGDEAHTVKYCPRGPYNPNPISTANSFKLARNSTGKIARRSKKQATF
ncbi:RNA-binding protein nanos [Mycetomoellerius zeteki]|uniref:RNA-binding protein nanos n=1 Tax=Mycetomoellerius zeteki TaxID=64791 RepID=UPI00084EC7F2|nr:PREDICTED: protein nanos [Trachymyrmex zeteki]